VGVTVGRLRRKLGDVGASVRTVPRRGYRLEVAG
jgi:DNA-binding winged helix-turn-helix (wHTH) protein